MESAILTRSRRQLATRFSLFVVGLISVFALQTSNQLQENQKRQQQRLLRLVGLIAAERLGENGRRARLSDDSRLASLTSPDLPSSNTAEIRILWIGPSMEILDEFGRFVPAGKLVPSPSERMRAQQISLPNGMGLWLPVSSQEQGAITHHGFVAIASSADNYSRDALISLVAASAASIMLGLLAIPWIVERSLQPLREQINRLHQFAGDVAHELRNPLMALKTTLANIDGQFSSTATPEIQIKVDAIGLITSRMARILDDILLLTSIESGENEDSESRTFINLADIFDELSILHDTEARQRHVDLVFTISSTIMLTVEPTRVLRILSNLISNAIRHSGEGASVHVSAGVAGGTVLITVDDDGPGIPPDQKDRVFERFVRLQGSPEDQPHAGIGLALSRSLAMLQGGSLEAEQRASGGCRMLLRLPLGTSQRRGWLRGGRLRP
jgi:signal transduction histidine kinase